MPDKYEDYKDKCRIVGCWVVKRLYAFCQSYRMGSRRIPFIRVLYSEAREWDSATASLLNWSTSFDKITNPNAALIIAQNHLFNAFMYHGDGTGKLIWH